MIKIWGNTDIGVVRKQNEDGFYFCSNAKGDRGYAVVCDGMGGANAGEVASEMAVKLFSQQAERLLAENMSVDEMNALIANATKEANAFIHQHAASDEALAGMGTTFVCLAYNGANVVIGNIGDSRAYLLNAEQMSQITVDHSLVQEMVSRGELNPIQAQRHPSRNVITRALGVDADVSCDLFQVTPQSGQYILLCSDGLTGEVSEPEIYYEIYQTEEAETACDRLIEMAKQRGGHDNITLVIAAFEGDA